MSQEIKLCQNCIRPFTNRKKWRRRGQWQKVIYCSRSCRQQAKQK